ncbi:hypothetical protein BU26DRAFT_316300 [Trematosphaeria pertusa]|uniref:SGNH hydrolase-type esterase domain-containing protein n=1 Tax=Trematosphaeria pertusa TaxID=390896 RepID=A0A6A6IGL9_9PLEO|nr:uncharacterized protein BU26DRAFT_316300 [Trematosphaeria pertusa]KAF2249327.1 hypothetical protein BU26DRAFT_316300 [Trematosphaeria pertusa]
MSTSTTTRSLSKINTSKFYLEWKGHPIKDLAKLRELVLQNRPDKPIVYLAGDSSLDNKYWVPSAGAGGEELGVETPEIYHQTLDRPRPKPDVAFWLNHLLGDSATCINAAIEESMLRERDLHLLSHDVFIRDNIRPQDILIVSVGANDVALRPTASTIWHMVQLAWLTSRSSLEHGTASSLSYFKELFGTKVEDYITRLTLRTKPRAIIVCMIYFPLEAKYGQQSWADMQLKVLGYNRNPEQLQIAIRKMYEIATHEIKIEGTEVVPCALFEVLDGSRKEDYTARVEPSKEGGRRMAERLRELVDEVLEKYRAAVSGSPQQ